MIVDQLFNPKPLKEGGPYDLPGIDYDRPGDAPRRPRPQGSTTPRRHDDEPDFMDPDQRRLRADQARVAKANAEYHAKKGVAEGTGQDSKSWMASIEQQHPGVKFVQAKMPGAPIIALVNGKPVAQFDTKQDVEEDLNRRGFLRGLGMAAAGAAGLGAAGAAQARATPEYLAKVERAKALMAKGQSREQTARIMGIKGPNPGGTGPMSGDWGAVNYAAQEMRVRESTNTKQHKLNEARLMEDPVYRNFKRVGRYISEQKLTEPEILQIFSDAETGMTDKATGANRTFVGRGKDATVDFAKDVAGAVNGVLNSIQNSVPVAAVDVAYDQATDALANLTGGQKGAAMEAIKKYRNLVKQYPKTAGFAKAALVAIAGLATGGAGLPAIAGLTYALDSAIKGDKLSSVLGKGAGTAALAAASQGIFGGATQTGPADTNAFTNVNQMGDYTGDYVNMPDPSDQVSGLVDPTPDLATYTVQDGDNLSTIADRFNTSVGELKGLNPQLAAASGATGGQGMNVDVIFPGQQITLPPGTPGTDVYAGGVGTSADTMADIAKGNVPNSPISQAMAAKGQAAADTATSAAPIDYTQAGPVSTDSLGQKLEYGIPVNDNGSFVPPNSSLPAGELAKQQAAYDTWKADFMKRFPNATLGADGVMQGIKPGLAPMQILTKPTLPAEVQESVKFKIIPASQLIDQKATVLSWALNESVGRRSHSVNLTTVGTYAVFENVERYRRALLEYVGQQPGRPELPDQYRPDMSGGAGVPSKPGLIGRGLNYLDRGVKKVGGALSNFGHQFTTNVTKEKLKMNWHQAGKPSDSDQLAAWLVGQGVPQEVVTSVFGKMGIPYTVPTAQPTAQPAAQTTAPKTGGASTQAYAGINPATKKPWTQQELRDKFYPEPAADSTASADTEQPLAPAATATSAASSKFPGEDPTGPGYVGRREVARRQAARDAEAAKKPAAPNFAPQGGGYKSVNYAPNIKTGINLPKPTAPAKPASTSTASKGGLDQAMMGKAKPGSLDAQIAQNLQAPGKATINTGGPNPNAKKKLATTDADMDAAEKAQLAKMTAKNPNLARLMATNPEATTESRIAMALEKPVAEMLQMVETKEDVQRIKQFVDDTFIKYGAVNESAFAVRNQIFEHVTQAGAQRRREYSQRVAH